MAEGKDLKIIRNRDPRKSDLREGDPRSRDPRSRDPRSREARERDLGDRDARSRRPRSSALDKDDPRSKKPRRNEPRKKGSENTEPRIKKPEATVAQNRGRKRSRNIRGILSTILLIIAACVFVYSAAQIVRLILPYHQGAQINQEIRDLHIRREPIPATAEDDEEIEIDDFYDYRFLIDFSRLIATNSDTIGWIRFLNPEEINYPLVHSHDNAEYLVRTFDGNYTQLGSIFMDMGNNSDFGDRNTNIYGHHMAVGGEMFSQLLEFQSREFMEENPHFFIYTPDGMRRVYRIFMAAVVHEDSHIYQQFFRDDDAFREYLELSRSLAMHFIDNEYLNASAQIVTLSTCTNIRDDERFIIQGVLIEERLFN